jgi:hypothetical protein
MKHNSIAVYGLSILLLLGAFSSIVYAGFDPTPFQPEINSLMAVVNELNSIENRLQNTLALPANEVGLINQLETMTNELTLLTDRVQAVQERVGSPPNPIEVCDAFLSVQDNTQDIIDVTNEVLSAPSDPLTPDVLEALELLNLEAISLVNQLLEQYCRINLLLPIEPIEVPEDVITFVLHGWATGGAISETLELPYWSEMTSEQQNEYLLTASFELSIDGVSVQLSRFQWYNQESDEMYVVYYVAFPPYTFTAGNAYTFVGFWSIEFNNVQYTYTETRTIIPY